MFDTHMLLYYSYSRAGMLAEEWACILLSSYTYDINVSLVCLQPAKDTTDNNNTMDHIEAERSCTNGEYLVR